MLAVVTHSASPHKVVVTIFVHSDVIMAGISMLVALALLAVVNIFVVVHAERLVVVQRLASFTLDFVFLIVISYKIINKDI